MINNEQQLLIYTDYWLLSPEGWICQEGDCVGVTQQPGHPKGVKKIIQFPFSCPACLKPAALLCEKCKSVYYCSEECQKKHWRLSHKQACSPNPKLYTFNTDLGQFHGLLKDYFQPHKFIVIKQTEATTREYNRYLWNCSRRLRWYFWWRFWNQPDWCFVGTNGADA
jgi:hypothetical protein